MMKVDLELYIPLGLSGAKAVLFCCFSACLIIRHSWLMLFRAKVWQIVLCEPKLPRINAVVIMMAKKCK